MSAADDRKFLAWFMRAVGVLAGFVAGMVLITSFVMSGAHVAPAKDQSADQQLAERLAPAAKVAVAGQDNSALNAAGAAAAAPAAPAAVLTGEQVYNSTCIACHGAGVAGAPKFADRSAWAPRAVQGLAVLHQHALAGFQGKSGVMPPKGGRADLADKSITNAVDYMVEAAK
jgi:cytochrome c5